MTQRNTKYGYLGWQEFLNNRLELIQEYEKALSKNKNRPVRTSHGNAGEAAARRFLEGFLPQKYGVTSGYIIPDIICQDYILYHYDVIIYDKFNAPVLWGESDYDNSEQGKKRAIPAQYVVSVIEVKSNFTKRSIHDSMKKLKDLNQLQNYLPQEFTCSTFFFEIKNGIIKKNKILKEFIQFKVLGFTGGIILKSEINSEMTGSIDLLNVEEKIYNQIKDNVLVKDVEEIELYRGDDGNVQLQGPGGCHIKCGKDKKLHFNKVYNSDIISEGKSGVSLSWSYNHFSQYIINLLGYLEGKKLDSANTPVFGQVFDVINYKKET